MSLTIKHLLVLGGLLWGFLAGSWGSPLAANYTTELLRIAKAAHIKAYMDPSQMPCDNFYSYACGRWSTYYPTSAKQMKTSYIDQLESIFLQRSLDLLRQQHQGDTKSDKMLKAFFKSCADTLVKEQVGIDVFLEVAELRGGWPLVEEPEWYEYDYDWLQVIAKLKQVLGLNVIVGLNIVPDFEDKDLNRIMIGSPELPLGSRRHYEHEDFQAERENYKKAIAQKMKKYFPKMPEHWFEEIAEEILGFEQNLAKGLPLNEELTVQQTTRQRYAGDLKSAYGNFVDMTRYLNIIFNETIYMQILETPEDYFSNLVEVIRQTPKLTIANYTAWKLIEHLDKENVLQKPTSEKQCVDQLVKYLPDHLENLFKRHSNYMHTVNELQSVWADIKRTFHDDFYPPTKLSWISSETRQKAAQKVDSMVMEIQSHDDKLLDEYFKAMKFNASNYQENIIKLINLHSHLQLGKLFEKPKNSVEKTILPKYYTTENKIYIPIKFLQERFFWDPAYPQAVKYSTLGLLLAQQMLQGFDSIGMEYDKYGHRRPWWDGFSAKVFKEKAECFQNQYEPYRKKYKLSKGLKMERTAITNSGAVSVAFRAYKKWFRNSIDPNIESKEYLSTLGLTNEKLFFLSFAQMWCANYDESLSEFDFIPGELTVIGALTNSDDFANCYKCEAGAKMHPANKCVLY